MSAFQFLVIAVGLLAAGFGGIVLARIYRSRRDAALTDASDGVWQFRSDTPLIPDAPFNQFGGTTIEPPFDIMAREEDGLRVTSFNVTPITARARIVRPCAIVELPVDGPALEMTEGDAVPTGLGPRLREELGLLSGVRVQMVPGALCVRSISAPSQVVQRTALQLARAVVADATSAVL